MNEDFYTPSTPQPRQPRSRSRGLGTTTYQFRQPQTRINPLALRRLELQNVESQRREEIAAGNQELAAVKEMAHLEQQEFAIRQGIIKEKQVASAQREVAKLDPLSDPQYASKYAEVMSRHPMAQDNKFLNESFTDGSKVNYRAAQHKFNELEEGQKQAGKEELAWIKASSAYATSGGDSSAFTDKDGQHDWNALNAARAKAALVTKAAAEKDNAGLPILKTVTKEGDTTVTREAPKPAKPELTEAQKIAQAKLEGTLTGQLHQQEIFQKQKNDPTATDDQKKQAAKNYDTTTGNLAVTQAQVDAVHGVVGAPPPSVKGGLTDDVRDTYTKLHAGLEQQLNGMSGKKLDAAELQNRNNLIGLINPLKEKLGFDPIAPDPRDPQRVTTNKVLDQEMGNAPAAASAQPTATGPTVPTAPQQAIDFLKANPQFAPHFDQKYGENASTEHLMD